MMFMIARFLTRTLYSRNHYNEHQLERDAFYNEENAISRQ